MHRHCLTAGLLVVLAAASASAQERKLLLDLAAGKTDAANAPVRVALSLPEAWADAAGVTVTLADGTRLPGQLVKPGLLTRDEKPAAPKLVRRDLYFVVPSLKAGAKATATVDFDAKKADDTWSWKIERGVTELVRSENGKTRPVLRSMAQSYEAGTKEERDKTYKVFHHLYDPAGTRFVTNGGHNDPYTDAKKLTFPHHRGLMYAFNRITYAGTKKADTWHATNGAHQAPESGVMAPPGPVLGRETLEIGWFGAEKEPPFAKEERELTVFAVPGGTLVEFASVLTPTRGTVKLDGDPQHAGFQFRAANAVAEKTAKQTYYLRPDGKGKPGETRNWDAKNKGPVDLPWDACSFVLDKDRFTAVYLNHPLNPKESRFSERDYGRFGCYFEAEITEKQPLTVNYRVWLQDGEMTGPQAQALYDAFAAPPTAQVRTKE